MIARILFCMVSLSTFAPAQEKALPQPADTASKPAGTFRFEPLFLEPTLPFLLASPGGGPDAALLLRQSLFQPVGPVRDGDRNITTIQGMWNAEVTRGKEYQTLWNIVGAVEGGAVGYLAYRHIKRYGLK